MINQKSTNRRCSAKEFKIYGDLYEELTKDYKTAVLSQKLNIDSDELIEPPNYDDISDPQEFFQDIEEKLQSFQDLWYVDALSKENISLLKNLVSQIKQNLNNPSEKNNLTNILKNLKKIFYNLARATQYFPSFDSQKWDSGDINKKDGRLHGNQLYPKFTTDWNVIKWGDLWSWYPDVYINGQKIISSIGFEAKDDCLSAYPDELEYLCSLRKTPEADKKINQMASYLIPRAIQFTAALYELFYNAVQANPIITVKPEITSGPYIAGDHLTGTFEIKNIGGVPIEFEELLLAGRFGNDTFDSGCPASSNICPDFVSAIQLPLTLKQGDEHSYTGNITLTNVGTYKFTPMYKNKADGKRYHDLVDSTGTPIQPILINVAPKPAAPSTPYSDAKLVEDVPIPGGNVILPGQNFTKTWKLKNTGTTTWNSNYKLSFVSYAGSNQMGDISSVPVSVTVTPESPIAISVNLTAPITPGTYSGYWQMQDPNGKLFGYMVSVKIVVSSGAHSFNTNDFVRVSGTEGAGLNVRPCASKNDCGTKCAVPDGSTGKVTGGPNTDSVYIWWEISWDNGSGSCPNGTTGWSAQGEAGINWLEKLSYPSEGNLIRVKGTIFTAIYLYKNGKKWLVKDDDIFTKMGYSNSNIKDLPSGMISSILFGGTIVGENTLIRLKDDANTYLIQNNQKRLITSDEALIANGYKPENVIDVTRAIMDMYPQGQDITMTPQVMVISPNGGDRWVKGNQHNIVWSATDDKEIKSVDIYLSSDGGNNWFPTPIASGLQNTGYFLWTPNLTSSNAKIKIVVTDTSNVTKEGFSGIFKIEDAYTYADLAIPSISASTDKVAPGQQITLTVTVANDGTGPSTPTYIRYYFSTTTRGREQHLGENYVGPLSQGSSKTFATDVTVPQTDALQGYIVAVVNINNDLNSLEITTDNNYASVPITIIDNQKPVINSLSYGWGFYKTGAEYPIYFDASDDRGIKSMEFYYKLDSDTTWRTITDYYIPGSNGILHSYQWTIPSSISLPASFSIKMIAKDAYGNITEKITDFYQLKDGNKPSIKVLSPNGGEIWDLGTTQTIKWEVNAPNGIYRMRLYLIRSGKSDEIADIPANTAGSCTWSDTGGSCSWAIPVQTYYVTSDGRIRITIEDNNGNTNEDLSDGYFMIRDTSTPPPAPWATPHAITATDCGSPVVAADEFNNVHMVYRCMQDNTVGGQTIKKQDIMYKKLTGTTWSEPSLVYSVTQSLDLQLSGCHYLESFGISADKNGFPHVVWVNGVYTTITDRNQNDIFYTYFNGTSWSVPINLSNDIPGFPGTTSLVWDTKKPLSGVKDEATSAVLNGKLYVFGGYNKPVLEYNPATDTWTTKGNIPYNGVERGGAAAIGNKIYVVGDWLGMNQGKELKIYDPSNDTWQKGPDLPVPRHWPSVVSAGEKLYVIGGEGGKKFDDNNVYDPQTNSWSTAASMPTPRSMASAVVVNDEIYVIGGDGSDVSVAILNTVEVYNPSTNTWTTKRSMPTGRWSALASVVNGKIYVIGGSGYSWEPTLNKVEEYDPEKDAWMSKTAMPTARRYMVGGTIGDSIYVVGGDDSNNDLTVNERVTISGGGSATVSSDPKIAVDASNNVHVVWLDGYSWNSDYTVTDGASIYYRKKDSTGGWSTASKLTTEHGVWPTLACDKNDKLHLVYQIDGKTIGYMKRDRTAWSTPVAFDVSTHAWLNLATDSSNNLHMVWYYPYTDNTGKIMQQILYSFFNGASWTTPEKVSDLLDGVYLPYYPSIAVDSSARPHVIFEEQEKGKIVYRYRDLDGWSTPIQLNLISQGLSQYSSSITASPDGRIHAVWVSYGGIFYNHADVGGSIKDITPPAISVIYPSAGSTLSIGSSYPISWYASDNIGISGITIEYAADGTKFTEIARDVSNNGVYEWTVPNIVSKNARVKVTASDASGNKGIGLSGVFSISDLTTPFVVVTSPQGGELFETGSQQKILWMSNDNVGVQKIDLHYTTDYGMSWNLIAKDVSGNEHIWTVPSIPSSTYRVKVLAYDASGNVGQGVSDGDFTVVSSEKPPQVPGNPSIENGASAIPINSTLSWQGSTPGAGESVTYDVYFGSYGSMTLASSNQTGTSYSPGTLKYGQPYMWQVVARDNHGNASPGPVWVFTSESESKPVIGVSPGNLFFQGSTDGALASQTLNIWNAGGGTLDWTATSDAPWLTLNKTTGTDAGTIVVSANSTGLADGSYNANITFSAQGASNSPILVPVTFIIYTVIQKCTYSISPSSKNFNTTGGSESISITAQNGCSWNAIASDNWITITSVSTGTGNGTVNYVVSSNADTNSRTSSISIAGQTFTITQEGSGAIKGVIQLPQTGQTKCYDYTGAEIACAGTGQDGDTKAGVPWSETRFADNGDGTITDNLTGLMWLKDANCAATIGYNPDGRGPGYLTWQQALDFIASINDGTYNVSKCASYNANHTDWRLPNINEIESLNNYGTFGVEWLNQQGFVNVPPFDDYWSSTNFAAIATPTLAYTSNGYPSVKSNYRWAFPVRGTTIGPVRLAKTGQSTSYAARDDGDLQSGISWPQPRFIDNGNGTITDNLTGLMWLKDANCAGTIGYNPNGTSDGTMTWQQALDFIASINDGTYNVSKCASYTVNHTDWRLPNVREIRSLMDYSRYDPSLPSGHPFINIQPFSSQHYYWTSTTYILLPYIALQENVLEAWITAYKKTDLHGVWLVRAGVGGPFGNSYTLVISKSGTGSGTVTSDPAGINCGSDCSENYSSGTSVTLTATVASGSTFAGWNVSGCTGTACTVTLDAAKSVTATFNVSGGGTATSVSLSQGWNLISLPIQPSDTAIATVLSGVSGKYTIVWAYTNSQWKGYDPSDTAGSDLVTMEAGKGYWIKMTSSDTLTISGAPPSTSLTLTEGWNLVGYNKTTTSSSSALLSAISSKCKIVWAYSNGQWKGYDPSDYVGSDLTEFTPGYGYWVKTTEAVEWQQ